MSRDIPTRQRQLVRARSGGVCELCGAQRAVNVHHRRPRGMGGSSDPLIHGLGNLLDLCAICHHRLEMNRERAYDQGWLVHAADNPCLRRIHCWTQTYGHAWVLLDDTGGTTWLDPIGHRLPEGLAA